MSENRGAWGQREDNVWWPGAGVPDESHHHQLFNQQQLGLVAAHQQQQAQHAAAQQLFYNKMASSFQNQSAVSSAGISSMRGYGAGGQGQWWYPTGMEANMQNFASPQTMLNRKMPRVAKDPKPRGRMTAYAFFVQICREEHKKKHPEENVVFAEFSRKCADRWKTMNDKEKKRFHEMADKDKKRYDSEMQNYVPPKGEKVRGKKRKNQKDPNAPKRSLSAFFIFCKDERAKVKEANPEYGVGDVAKELGKRWAEADPSEKSKYEAMAEKEKAKYDKEMTEYKKKSKLTTTPIPVKPESEDEEEEEEDEEDDE